MCCWEDGPVSLEIFPPVVIFVSLSTDQVRAGPSKERTDNNYGTHRDNRVALSCEEIHEQITAYVDDRVDEEEYRQKVAAHIESCSACRDEYEREIMTKMVIRQRFPRIGTPSDLRSTIEEGLDGVATGRTGVRRRAYTATSRRRSPQRSILLLLLVIAGLATYILLFNDSSSGPVTDADREAQSRSRTERTTPSRTITGPANPFNLAMENFEGALTGEFTIGHETGDLAELKSYFSRNGVPSVAFAGVPMQLKGGTVKTHGGQPIPHIVYSDDGSTLYLFEIGWENLQAGKGVYITEDVAQKLSAGESIWVDVSRDANLVMYKSGNVVEVVVANRGPADMRRMLGLPAAQ